MKFKHWLKKYKAKRKWRAIFRKLIDYHTEYLQRDMYLADKFPSGSVPVSRAQIHQVKQNESGEWGLSYNPDTKISLVRIKGVNF